MSTIVKLALACAVQCFGGNALAQTTFNHLDCWFDESASQMRCPGSLPIQSGRDARVEQTFDIVRGEPALSNGQDMSVQEAKPAPEAKSSTEAKPEPTRSNERVRRTSTRMAQAPRCTRYRTYNAATGSYRGYDGVTRACR
ncbi:BA14K family protein [Flaviflagellibacter deserti]|uniref:BA14K family protein n=1 Tax=Flaviflagellibacter deserti TaxID=2267266 RepID=A0ABV9Z1Z9_9HYPH